MMNDLKDLATSIAGRDDADMLTPEEFHVIGVGTAELEKVREFVNAMLDLCAQMQTVKTVGDARRLIVRAHEVDRMADDV